MHQREGERTHKASKGLIGGFGFPSEYGRVCQDFQCVRALDGSLFLSTCLRVVIATMCPEPQESVNEEMEDREAHQFARGHTEDKA